MPQPLSCQPQSDTPQPLQSSRLTSAAAVVPMRQMGVPLGSTEPMNCTNTESFAQLFPVGLAADPEPVRLAGLGVEGHLEVVDRIGRAPSSACRAGVGVPQLARRRPRSCRSSTPHAPATIGRPRRRARLAGLPGSGRRGRCAGAVGFGEDRRVVLQRARRGGEEDGARQHDLVD